MYTGTWACIYIHVYICACRPRYFACWWSISLYTHSIWGSVIRRHSIYTHAICIHTRTHMYNLRPAYIRQIINVSWRENIARCRSTCMVRDDQSDPMECGQSDQLVMWAEA